MASNIKKIYPTDIISDSMDKINYNFDILNSYAAFSNKSLHNYYKTIDELVNKISSRIDISEGQLYIELEKVKGDIKSYNVDVSSINQMANEIQLTVKNLKKDVDGSIEETKSQITQTANRIDSVVSSYKKDNETYQSNINKILGGLQDQIDGNIETWYYEGEPSLTNEPAISWVKDAANEEERNKAYAKHQGDLYYDKNSGLAYRFFKNDEHYKWELIRDHDITKLLSDIGEKANIFTDTPYTPYKKGDLWIDSNKDLFVCIKSRESGIWSRDDWDYATRYKMDLDEFKKKYQTEKEDLQNQIDGKVQYWFSDIDPSDNWTDDETKKSHLNDLWYDGETTKVYIKTDSGYEWWKTTDKDLKNLVQSVKDGNISIFYGDIEPSGYKKGDIWYDCTYPVGTTMSDQNNKYYHDTLRCQTNQDDSLFNIEHWVPINGPDMPFSKISQTINTINLEVFGSTEKDSLRSLIIQKVDTGDFETAKTTFTNQINSINSDLTSKISSVVEKTDGLETSYNSLESKVTSDKSEILAKLNSMATDDTVKGIQTSLTELSNTVSKNNTDITASLELKAESSDLDKTNNSLANLTTRVGTTETTLTTQANEINGVKTSVGKLESIIGSGGDGSGTSVSAALKVLTEKDKEHDSAINTLQSSITTNEDTIAQAKIDIQTNKDNITNLTSSVAEIKTTAGNAASKVELNTLSDRVTGNETSIANLTTEISGQDGKSGLKAGLENAVSRIGTNETSISSLVSKIGDDKSGIISQINTQSKIISGIQTTQASMQSTIDGHTASIETKVSKDELKNTISNIKIDADNIKISAGKKLSLLGNKFELVSDNCTIDEKGTITAKNAKISGNIETNTLSAETDTKKTVINGDTFKISTKNNTSPASISITIIDDMKNISGYTDAPIDLQSAKNIPTLCMEYNGKQYYLWPGAWKNITSASDTDWTKTILFSKGDYVSLDNYRLINSISSLETLLNSHASISSGDDITDIGLYFINADNAYVTRNSNLSVYNYSFMPELLTGKLNDSSTSSNPKNQNTENYISTYKKLTDLSNSSDIWNEVCEFYQDFTNGGYVEIGKTCKTISVDSAYNEIVNGDDQNTANTVLGINALTDKFLLDTAGVSVSGLRIRQSDKTIYSSNVSSSFGINVFDVVTKLIPATASTTDEHTIKDFIGNTKSKTEVYAYISGSEFVVLSYPIYPVKFGEKIYDQSKLKVLYVLVCSMNNDWYNDGEYSSTANKQFNLSYLIDTLPEFNTDGSQLTSNDANIKKKKILATLIQKLNQSSEGFTVEIPYREGNDLNNLTLFTCFDNM